MGLKLGLFKARRSSRLKQPKAEGDGSPNTIRRIPVIEENDPEVKGETEEKVEEYRGKRIIERVQDRVKG